MAGKQVVAYVSFTTHTAKPRPSGAASQSDFLKPRFLFKGLFSAEYQSLLSSQWAELVEARLLFDLWALTGSARGCISVRGCAFERLVYSVEDKLSKVKVRN